MLRSGSESTTDTFLASYARGEITADAAAAVRPEREDTPDVACGPMQVALLTAPFPAPDTTSTTTTTTTGVVDPFAATKGKAALQEALRRQGVLRARCGEVMEFLFATQVRAVAVCARHCEVKLIASSFRRWSVWASQKLRDAAVTMCRALLKGRSVAGRVDVECPPSRGVKVGERYQGREPGGTLQCMSPLSMVSTRGVSRGREASASAAVSLSASTRGASRTPSDAGTIVEESARIHAQLQRQRGRLKHIITTGKVSFP